MPKPKVGRPTTGSVEKLPSGRYRARFTGPDGQRHKASVTFEDVKAARLWIDRQIRSIEDDPEAWIPPTAKAAAARAAQETFGAFAEPWLADRRTKGGKPLADRTRAHYRDLLDRFILPTLGDLPLKAITTDHIDAWHRELPDDRPTYKAHAYGLVRAILNTAFDKGKITFQPARITGAGNVDRARKITPATREEIATIAATMPERRRLMILLAASCGLRYGEIAELRRKDFKTKPKSGLRYIDVCRGVIRVRELDADGKPRIVRKVKSPKTNAGIREVTIPPHIIDTVDDHLKRFTEPGKESLLFPGPDGLQLSPAAFYGRETTFTVKGVQTVKGHGFFEARRLAGRADLPFHALRHTALTDAANAGYTVADLQEMAGHATAAAAMRYQHAATEDQKKIERAERLAKVQQGEL